MTDSEKLAIQEMVRQYGVDGTLVGMVEVLRSMIGQKEWSRATVLTMDLVAEKLDQIIDQIS